MNTLTTQELWERLGEQAPQAMTDVAHWLFGVADDALSRNDSEQYVFAAFLRRSECTMHICFPLYTPYPCFHQN